MYMSDFYSNIMTQQYCTRTVRITNVQLENYKPVTQKNLNGKLTLNKRPT
jgi:hypothetical protein